MSLYAFSLDLDRCIGCQACTVACKTGNERPLGDNYIKVRDIVSGQMPNLFGTFAHHRCFHCADAACVTVCPTGTLTKAANGMTAVDLGKCSGCGYCTEACPYKVPTLVDGHVSKCVACVEPVQEGGLPYCVQTCPSQAIKFGERDKLLAEAQARVSALQARYPNAQVYGQSQLGGLGLLTILLDRPEVYDLPENPALPSLLYVWQRIVRPFSLPLAALSVAFTGVAFVIARRQHLHHKAAMEAEAAVQAGERGASQAESAPLETPPVAQAGPEAATQAEGAPVETSPAAQSDAQGVTPAETAPAAQTSDLDEQASDKEE